MVLYDQVVEYPSGYSSRSTFYHMCSQVHDTQDFKFFGLLLTYWLAPQLSNTRAKLLDCYDVSVQPQTRPHSSLTFVRPHTPFVAYTPKPHGHNLCATISLLGLSYCPYVFCVDCSYLWATGHASYCSDHVYRRDERGGERSSRFYRPLTRCARYANYVYISRFYRPLTRCASLTETRIVIHINICRILYYHYYRDCVSIVRRCSACTLTLPQKYAGVHTRLVHHDTKGALGICNTL